MTDLNQMSLPTARQSLKKDTVYVYIGHFLKYLSPLILIPYFSRVLGPEGYGQVLAAIALMSMVGVVLNYGFFFSGIRDMASARSDRERGRILGQQTFGRVLLLPIALAVGVLGTYYSPSLRANIWFGVFATLLGFLYGFGFSWLFQGLRQFKKAILLEAIVYPLNVVFALLFVRKAEDGLYVLISLFVAVTISMLISLFYVRKEVSIFEGSFHSGAVEIKQTTILFITSMNATLLTVGSTYVLSMMATPEQVGYYGSAEKFVTVAVGLLNPIGQVLMPTISKLHKERAGHTLTLVKKGILLELAYGLAGPLAGFTIAPFFLVLVLGEKFLPSVGLFQALVMILPFAALKHALFFYVLVPLRKENHYLMVSLLNVAASLAFAFFLVPRIGAMGMAYARVLAEVAATFFLLGTLWRHGVIQKLRQCHAPQEEKAAP
jgi:PST family polysaccharide transporter